MPCVTNSSLIALRDRIRRIEQPARHGVLPFGVAAIDGALPGGGLALGAVHEITGAGGDEEDGAAAAGFAAGILARLSAGPNPPPLAGEGIAVPRSPLPRKRGRVRVGAESGAAQGPVLWCLRRPDLYGPGLLAHGLDPARLVLVRASRDDAILWAVEAPVRLRGWPPWSARSAICRWSRAAACSSLPSAPASPR